MASLDAFSASLSSASELSDSPSLAAAAASTGDIQSSADSAQLLQQVNYITNLKSAAATLPATTEKHSGFSVFHVLGEAASALRDPLTAVGGAVGTGLEYLNKPLKEVQNDYRFVRDSFQHGGFEQGIAALAVAGGAGIVGNIILPGSGMLAADAALGALRNTAKTGALGGDFQNYAKMAEAPGGGSIGRDIASLIHFDPHVGSLHLVSGALDGAFDVGAFGGALGDPVAAAGALRTARLAQIYKLQPGKLSELYHAPMVSNPVKRVIDSIAEADNGQDVQRLIPTASRQQAQKLAGINAPHDVIQYFEDNQQAREFLGQQAPRLSWIGKNVTKPLASKIVNVGTDPTRDLQSAQAIADGDLTPTGLPGLTRTQKFVQSATTHTPLFIDYEGRKVFDQDGNEQILRSMSRKDFDPAKESSVNVVRDFAKFSLNNRVANSLADIYSAAGLNDRVRIWKNVVVATAAQMGLKDHPAVYQDFINKTEEYFQHQEGVYAAIPADEQAKYALGNNELSKVTQVAPDGLERTPSAAMWNTQQGNLPIPDFMAMRRAIGELDANKIAGVNGYKLNDAFYDHVTQPIFKRLALATGGFALRVASGEALYNMLNEGPKQYVDSAIARAAASARTTLTDTEKQHRMAQMVYTFSDKLGDTKWFDKRLIDTAADLQQRNGAPVVPGMLNADHYHQDTGESQQNRIAFNLYKTQQKGSVSFRKGSWQLISGDHQDFAPQWKHHLLQIEGDSGGRKAADIYRSHLAAAGGDAQAATDSAAKEYAAWLQTVGKNTTKGLMRATPEVLAQNGGWRGFARNRILAVRGATEGASGLNPELLDAIADGTVKDVQVPDLAAKSLMQRPTQVPGQITEIVNTGGTERFFNTFHKKVASPIINSLSRKQIYIGKVADKMDALQPSIDAGLMTKSEAYDQAEQAALKDLIPQVHNPQLRSQLHDVTRNVMPFFFAQEQALRRYGRLAVKDPSAIHKIQMAHEAMVNSGFVQKDPGTGEEYLMYPGSTMTSKALTHVLSPFMGGGLIGGMPIGVQGSMASLASVVPSGDVGMDFGGPVFAVPLKLLQTFDPASSEFTQAALGDQAGSTGIWQELIPNAPLRSLITAYAGDHSRAFESNQMAALKWVYANHPELLNDPSKMTELEQQHVLEASKGAARATLGLKAILGMVLPLAPSMDIGRDVFSDDFNKALTQANGSIADAINIFHKEHPDKDVTPYTVFQSKTDAGPYVPASEKALQFYEQNQALLKEFPDAGAYLIPQMSEGNGDRQAIYNSQIALGLRHKKSPEEFQKDLYIAAGNAQYFARHDAMQAQVKATQDPDAQTNLKSSFSAWQQQYEMMNPVWANWFLSQDRQVKRAKGIEQLNVLYSQNKVPQSAQSSMLGDVLAQYNQKQSYVDQLATLRQTNRVSAAKKSANMAFQSYLKAQADAHPELQPVIRGLFWDGTLDQDI